MEKFIVVVAIVISFLAFLWVIRLLKRMFTIVNCTHKTTKDEVYVIRNSLGHPIAKFKGTTCTKCHSTLEYRALPMEK